MARGVVNLMIGVGQKIRNVRRANIRLRSQQSELRFGMSGEISNKVKI